MRLRDTTTVPEARPARAREEGPQRRAFSLELRADGDPESREVNGTAVTFDTRNAYWEVFVPGAFKNSLAAKSDRKPFVMGYLHTTPIGRWTQFEERFDEEVKGLAVAGPISATRDGDDALTLVRDGAITGLSIGFYSLSEVYADPGEEVIFPTEDFGEVRYQFDGPTFYVLEADVVETSLVMAPADDEARLNSRRRAIRSIPEPEAPDDELLESMRELAAAQEHQLEIAARQAVVMKLATRLRAPSRREAAADEAAAGAGNLPGERTDEPAEPPVASDRGALTDLLDVSIESITDDDTSHDDVIGMLSEASGLDGTDVELTLSGEREPTRDDLTAFADVLGIPADDLIAAAEEDGQELSVEEDDASVSAAVASLRDSVSGLREQIRPTV